MNELNNIEDERIFLPNKNSDNSIKEKLSLFLFDKNNPEMITYLFNSEITKISAIESVIEEEDKQRKALDLENNIFTKYLNRIKIHRTSLKGWRAEQGVKIIQSNIEQQEKDKNALGLNILGGAK